MFEKYYLNSSKPKVAKPESENKEGGEDKSVYRRFNLKKGVIDENKDQRISWYSASRNNSK